MRRRTERYLRKGWAVCKLLALFARELILSTWSVIRHLLKRRLEMRPGIVAISTDLKSDWEITLLANLITLTPGTVTMEISHDRKTLYIHAMDIADADKLEAQIKNTFEKAVMEVSR